MAKRPRTAEGTARARTTSRAPTAAKVAGGGATERLAQNVVRMIKAVAWIMGLTVVSIELWNAPLDEFTRYFDNSGLMKLGLVIFFFGWLWGATSDTEIQRVGYCADPEEGRLGAKELAGILVFLLAFAALFILHNRLVLFQLFLLVFIIVNTFTWRIVFDRTRPMIESTYESFTTSDAESRANCSLAKLLLVVEYMNGPWQRHRFVTLILLAALQLVVAILLASGMLAPLAAGLSVRGVSGAVLAGYLPGILFILYVLISELWMKIYRIKLFSDVNTIDFLESHFTVSKRRDAALPRPHLAGAFDFSPSPNQNYVGHGPIKWLLDFL